MNPITSSCQGFQDDMAHEKKELSTIQMIAACSIWSGLILGAINIESDRCVRSIQDPSFTIVSVILILSGTVAAGFSSKQRQI